MNAPATTDIYTLSLHDALPIYHGLVEHFVYTGAHSIGVAEFEPPSLASTHAEALKENMTFSIDIPLFFAPWGGLRYESGYRVTDGEPEALQSLSDEIIRR